MATNSYAPHFVLAAVKRIYSDLPDLVGFDKWKEIHQQIDIYVAELEAKPNANFTSTQLFGLLAQYEPTRYRMIQELNIQKAISINIAESMQHIALSLQIDSSFIDGLIAAVFSHMKWQIDPTTIPISDGDMQHRGITMREGGIEGASITFRQMQIDFGDFSKLAAGFITTGVGIIAAPTVPLALPLLAIAGVLSTLSALYENMKNELSEQEASVFWGMIQAVGNMRGAGLKEAFIITTTNAEREKYGLQVLTETQIRLSLTKLVKINSIKKTDDTYFIMERYTIKE